MSPQVCISVRTEIGNSPFYCIVLTKSLAMNLEKYQRSVFRCDGYAKQHKFRMHVFVSPFSFRGHVYDDAFIFSLSHHELLKDTVLAGRSMRICGWSVLGRSDLILNSMPLLNPIIMKDLLFRCEAFSPARPII